MSGRALTLAFCLVVAVSPAPTFAEAANDAAANKEAAAAAAEPLVVAPGRDGYAFGQPRILAQQRLLGIAHGVSLLASACMDLPAHLDATLAAYLPWRERQESTIAAAQKELARHYFGARAAEARWPDLLRALQLRNQLDLAPGSAELAAACATLPEALSRPRYALERQFELQGLLAEATTGIAAELRRDWCRERLEGDARLLFDVRYDTWREFNVLRLARAHSILNSEWPAEAPAGSFAQWADELRREARVRGSAEDCLDFSESLKQPQAALRRLFAPTPGLAP